MPVLFDQELGAELEFPDGMDPVQMSAARQRLLADQQARQQKAQMLGSIGQLVSGFAGGGSEPAPQMATVDPRAAFVMTPQTMNAYMERQQGALNQQADRAHESEIEKARQRIQMQKMLQDSKDESNRLALDEKRFDLERRAKMLEQKKQDWDMQMEERKMRMGTVEKGPGDSIYQVVPDASGNMVANQMVAPQWNPYSALRYQEQPVTIGGKTYSVVPDSYSQGTGSKLYTDGTNTYTPEDLVALHGAAPAGGQGAGAGAGEQLTLDDIADETVSFFGNDNRTNFINIARQYGYSDDEIQKYVDTYKIYDDNVGGLDPRTWFQKGEQKPVSAYPRGEVSPPANAEGMETYTQPAPGTQGQVPVANTPEEAATFRAQGIVFRLPDGRMGG